MLLDKKGVFVMRIMNVLALSLAAVTLIGAPANASAQIPLADILNRLEVRRLETSPNAAAHHKLAAHFSALAQRYTAIAKRYAAMARALPGNPNRETSFGREIHFKHLAELNTQWATTARELAGHHERLAAGSESVLPRGGERLEGGRGLPNPAKRISPPLRQTPVPPLIIGNSKQPTLTAPTNTPPRRGSMLRWRAPTEARKSPPPQRIAINLSRRRAAPQRRRQQQRSDKKNSSPPKDDSF